MPEESKPNPITLAHADERPLLDRPHPNRQPMQSENLWPYAEPFDYEQKYGPTHPFDPLPTTGKLRTLAHLASVPPTREILTLLHEQTELALIALRKPEGRRAVLLDQLQMCEATIRWLLHEAKQQPRMAGKLASAAMTVQANLARLVVLLDQTEGQQPSRGLKDVGGVRADLEGDQ
jgi:hypothetical protein